MTTSLHVDWRVSPEHVDLLPAGSPAPQIPSPNLPNLHDLVQLSDGRYWIVFCHSWEHQPQGYKLVLWIQPAPDKPDMPGHTLH